MSVTVRRYRETKAWEIDIRVRRPDGSILRERRKAPMSSKTAARKWGEQRALHLALHGRPPVAAAAVPTLSRFFPRFIRDHCEANGHKPSGIAAKRSAFRVHLQPRMGSKRLDEISAEDVAALKSSMRKSAASTTNNVLTILNTCMRCAVEWGVVKSVPVEIQMLKVPTRAPRFYDFDEYERLVAAACPNPLATALILLCGDAGLRRGEALALEWADCDLDRRVLCVQRSEWNGEVTAAKGLTHRYVPMTSRLATALGALDNGAGDRVLACSASRAPTARSLRRWFAAVQKKAGLPATGGLHLLRHSFCARLAMRGASPYVIQRLAGHHDFKTTTRYLGLTDAEARRAVALLAGNASYA